MKSLVHPSQALGAGLQSIRTEFHVPEAFPPEVLAAAEAAAKRVPDSHVDRTAMPFVTLDPASSTDLDQAFSIETSGDDILLHYAIADVAWFVADGDPIEISTPQRRVSGQAVLRQGIRPDTLLLIGQFAHWETPLAKDFDIPSLNSLATMSIALTDATGSGAHLRRTSRQRTNP